mmetsp:Transcript_945/g.939  ORF Transcript_945/g.939 Transcript_945/m.939 type:complete len:198 (-) Transcript_945:44-637(-)
MEGAILHRQQFYCHACLRTSPIYTNELICPRCGGEFLEHVNIDLSRMYRQRNDSTEHSLLDSDSDLSEDSDDPFYNDEQSMSEFDRSFSSSSSSSSNLENYIDSIESGSEELPSNSRFESISRMANNNFSNRASNNHRRAKIKQMTDEFSSKVCSICLDEIDNGASIKVLYCDHFYHPDCIDRWLSMKKSCPMCRKK